MTKKIKRKQKITTVADIVMRTHSGDLLVFDSNIDEFMLLGMLIKAADIASEDDEEL